MKIGSKVMCVKSKPVWGCIDSFKYPVIGKTYTVREVFNKITGYVGLRFEELINPEFRFKEGVHEVAFDINCFREVDTIIELSHFTADELLEELEPITV